MISLIAVIGNNNELGKDNKLLWNLPNDLLYFKKITINHTVIMGYKTYLSIGKSLPDRRNVVISSRDLNIDNIICYKSMNDLVENEIKNNEEVFIIGGASLYNYFINKADRLYITRVYDNVDADVYLPFFNENYYSIISENDDIDNGYKLKRFIYERKK